jgi:hypothetical protein
MKRIERHAQEHDPKKKEEKRKRKGVTILRIKYEERDIIQRGVIIPSSIHTRAHLDLGL